MFSQTTQVPTGTSLFQVRLTPTPQLLEMVVQELFKLIKVLTQSLKLQEPIQIFPSILLAGLVSKTEVLLHLHPVLALVLPILVLVKYKMFQIQSPALSPTHFKMERLLFIKMFRDP